MLFIATYLFFASIYDYLTMQNLGIASQSNQVGQM